MREIWRDIVGWEDSFQVSNYGNVKRIAPASGTRPGRLLKSYPLNGYPSVNLHVLKRKQTLYIHRLVLEAFIGPCPSKMITRHLDGNRQNNQLSNLVWGTYSENEQDKIQHGTKICGSKIFNSKLNELKVGKIKKLLQQGQCGNPGKKITCTEIAKIFNVSVSTISLIQCGKRWKHVPYTMEN